MLTWRNDAEDTKFRQGDVSSHLPLPVKTVTHTHTHKHTHTATASLNPDKRL